MYYIVTLLRIVTLLCHIHTLILCAYIEKIDWFEKQFQLILRVICISTQNGNIKIMQMYTGLYLNLFPYDCVLSCYSMVHNIELNNDHKLSFLLSEIQMYMQTCLELNTYLYLKCTDMAKSEALGVSFFLDFILQAYNGFALKV